MWKCKHSKTFYKYVCFKILSYGQLFVYTCSWLKGTSHSLTSCCATLFLTYRNDSYHVMCLFVILVTHSNSMHIFWISMFWSQWSIMFLQLVCLFGALSLRILHLSPTYVRSSKKKTSSLLLIALFVFWPAKPAFSIQPLFLCMYALVEIFVYNMNV